MDNFNKIISFVLGLVVVIVFLTIITGRFNLRNKIKSLGQKKVSPTPTVSVRRYLSPTLASTGVLSQNNANTSSSAQNSPTSIPATGSPSLFLPIFFSTFTFGIYLKRKGRKD